MHTDFRPNIQGVSKKLYLFPNVAFMSTNSNIVLFLHPNERPSRPIGSGCGGSGGSNSGLVRRQHWQSPCGGGGGGMVYIRLAEERYCFYHLIFSFAWLKEAWLTLKYCANFAGFRYSAIT